MTVSDPAWPASTSFDLIEDGLKDEANKKEFLKKGAAIYAFTLKNKEGKEKSWYLDLKEKGEIAQGAAPEGKKANVTLVLSDEDFGKLVDGKAKAQSLFMGGKLKIKGDMMKATKLEPILGAAKSKL